MSFKFNLVTNYFFDNRQKLFIGILPGYVFPNKWQYARPPALHCITLNVIFQLFDNSWNALKRTGSRQWIKEIKRDRQNGSALIIQLFTSTIVRRYIRVCTLKIFFCCQIIIGYSEKKHFKNLLSLKSMK